MQKKGFNVGFYVAKEDFYEPKLAKLKFEEMWWHVFKPGDWMRKLFLFFHLVTQAYLENEIPGSPNKSQIFDLPITS